ncbi:MAG: hypothetical protein ACE5J2_05820 [Nitrososphaerales archaeon]
MTINLERDEHIIAGLPKVWVNELGFMGLLKKSREGILVLTNQKIIFVAKWFNVTPRERPKYFDKGEVRVTRIDGYSESELDEDISDNPKTTIIPLESIVDVESAELRKVNFLRIKFRTDGKTKTYDFGLAKTMTSYPVRQPLQYLDINWGPWIRLINAYM